MIRGKDIWMDGITLGVLAGVWCVSAQAPDLARARQNQDGGSEMAASIFEMPAGRESQDLSNRVARLEESVLLVDKRLGRTTQAVTPYNSVEKRLTDLERRVTQMERQLDQLNRRMQKVESKK